MPDNTPSTGSTTLRLAAASAEITPSRPCPLGGFDVQTRSGAWTEIADPLEVNVVVLAGADGPLVLVSLDTLFVSQPFVDQVESALAETESGRLPRMLFFASHTHFAPSLDPGKPELGAIDADTVATCARQTAAAIHAALASETQPLTLAGASTPLPGIVHRRRIGWSLRSGRPSRTCNIAPNPAGPVDADLNLICLNGPDGVPQACLVKAACHPVAYPELRHVSADFPGAIRRSLRTFFARPDLPVVFLQGFSGSARPDFRSTWVPAPGAPAVKHVAKRLLNGPQFVRPDRAQYQAWIEGMALAVGQACRSLQPLSQAADWTHAQVRVPISDLLAAPQAAGVPDMLLHHVRLGDTLQLFAVGAEMVAEQLEPMRALLPLAGQTLLVGCCGPSFGYLPTEAMIAEGGYEGGEFFPFFGLSGTFASGSDARLRDACQQLLAVGV